MTNTAKVFLGIITFLPLVFGICCLAYYIMMIKDMIVSMPVNPDESRRFAQSYVAHIFSGPLIMFAILSFVTHIGLMIYYIIHVVTYKVKTEGEKVMWILLFVFIGTIAFIIYFFMRVVPLPARGAAINDGIGTSHE